MSTVWRWLSPVLLLLVAIVAAIWGYGRLTSPSAAQREAVALMQAAPMGEGENGFPLMMALPKAPGPFPSGVSCGEATQPSCVDAIESAPEANAAALAPFRPQLEAAARALHAPVFHDRRSDVAMGVDDIPAFEPVTRLDSLRALDFAAGNTGGALAAACEDALGATRWAADPDTLLQAMIGIAIFRQHAALIADMRRRAPTDAMPASCAALALAPDVAVEGSLCSALRGEWRYQRRTLPSLEASMREQDGAHWASFATPLMHDTEWMLARSAENFAGACGEAGRQAAREDRSFDFSSTEQRWVDRVAYPITTMLLGVSFPAYTDYQDRQLDFVAQRRLLAALLQMDAMPATLAPAERFAALPSALRDGPRPLVLADDGASLSVPQRARRSEQEGRELRLPLLAAAAPVVATPPSP